jgi:hypothetical protein
MQQGPPELDGSIDNEYVVLIALALVIVGVMVAFAGRRVWKPTMSFVGAMVGGTMGYVIGYALGGWLLAIVVAMLAAFIGSVIFVFISHVALGLIAGFITYLVVVALTGNEIAGIIIAVVAVVVTYVYIEQAIGIVTAVIGGLAAGLGLIWLEQDMLVSVLVMLALMVFGAAFQMTALAEEQRRRADAYGVPTAAAGAAPTPPAMPGRTCSVCGGPLTYVEQYNRHYCPRCQRYE